MNTPENLNLLPEWLGTDQIAAVAQEHETPLYVYSEEALRAQASAANELEAPYGLTVRYAMKANSNDEILKTFLDEGLHIDASSGYEAEHAIKLGFEPEQIMITSQQLPKNLEELVEQGVLFNATSLHQLETYCRLFPGSNVSVRINPGVGSGMNNRTNTGGVSSSFGIWHEYIPEVKQITAAAGVTIDKIHTHIGSGTDPDAWQEAAATSLDVVRQFPDVISLDLGGGFKVARMPDENSADMAAIGARIEHLLKEFAAETGRELALEIEPGTFLVANAGILIAEVIDLADTGDKGYHFTKVNTGMNDLMRPSLYGAQHPITVVGADGQLPTESRETMVVGHNCESGDIFTPAPSDPEQLAPRLLGAASIGDLVVIGGAGAYGAAMAAERYCGYPSAKEVFV